MDNQKAEKIIELVTNQAENIADTIQFGASDQLQPLDKEEVEVAEGIIEQLTPLSRIPISHVFPRIFGVFSKVNEENISLL